MAQTGQPASNPEDTGVTPTSTPLPPTDLPLAQSSDMQAAETSDASRPVLETHEDVAPPTPPAAPKLLSTKPIMFRGEDGRMKRVPHTAENERLAIETSQHDIIPTRIQDKVSHFADIQAEPGEQKPGDLRDDSTMSAIQDVRV